MPLDEIEKVVDKVMSPERITRWIVRIVLLIVLISVGVTVTKIALHMNTKVDLVTTDRAWFKSRIEEIAGSRIGETLAQQALARHQEEVAKRSGLLSVSRKEDRMESRRLNQQIFEEQKDRVLLVKEYNSRASQVTDDRLAGLPKHLSLKQLTIEETPVEQMRPQK